jgi:chromosome segregation ATPase
VIMQEIGVRMGKLEIIKVATHNLAAANTRIVELETEVEDWQLRFMESKHEVERLRDDLATVTNDAELLRQDMRRFMATNEQLKAELAALREPQRTKGENQ